MYGFPEQSFSPSYCPPSPIIWIFFFIDLNQNTQLERFHVKDDYMKTTINVTIFNICQAVSGFPSLTPSPPCLPASLPPSPCVILLLFIQQAAAVCPHRSLSLYLLARSTAGLLLPQRGTLGPSHSLRLDSLVFANGWSLFPSKRSDFLKSEWAFTAKVP